MIQKAFIRIGAIALITAATAVIAASPPVETEPTLKTSDFRGLPPLSGPSYKVDPTVPVSGYQGQFTLNTDLGTVKADGSEILPQRVKEVAAADQLQKLSTSDVFVSALAKSAGQGVQAVGQAVTHPVDTIKNVPAGIGRFFGRITDTVSQTVSDGPSGVGDSMGIGKARRQLAKQVGVDPYTSNPQISSRLDSLSKAAFAGGVSLDVVFAVASGGAIAAVSFTKTVSTIAWELPPEDIRARNQTNLAALTVSQSSSDAFLGNTTYTPTLSLAFVEALKALGATNGADAFTQLATGAQTETEARFYINQLRMANVYKKENRIDRLEITGKIGAMRTGNRLFVPLPVDYLSWTEGIKAAAQRTDTDGDRVVWLTGELSRRAREGFKDNRLTFREHAPLD